jgi:hypothetical protein
MPTINDAQNISGPLPIGVPGSDPTQVEFTSGAAGSVPPGVSNVILNGVGLTFALTFPAPTVDGQVLRVLFATAVSTAFSAVVTVPAATIKTVPSTQSAGTGISWIYRAADATWYRRY